MTSHRIDRVQSLIAQTIASLLVRGEIKDPRVNTLASIGEVQVAKDLSWAKVAVSGYFEQNELTKVVAGLNSAAGYIQSQLAKAMQTRLTPKLIFYPDLGARIGFEMNKKLQEISRIDAQKGDAGPK